MHSLLTAALSVEQCRLMARECITQAEENESFAKRCDPALTFAVAEAAESARRWRALAALCEREAAAFGAEPLEWMEHAGKARASLLPRSVVGLWFGSTECAVGQAEAEDASTTEKDVRIAALEGTITTLLATVREMEQRRDELRRQK